MLQLKRTRLKATSEPLTEKKVTFEDGDLETTETDNDDENTEKSKKKNSKKKKKKAAQV